MGYKALPKDPSDHKVVQLKGWPKLAWYQTDSCPKPPKEWIPPSRQSPHSTAYIEVLTTRVSTFLVIGRSALPQQVFSIKVLLNQRLIQISSEEYDEIFF